VTVRCLLIDCLITKSAQNSHFHLLLARHVVIPLFHQYFLCQNLFHCDFFIKNARMRKGDVNQRPAFTSKQRHN